MDKDEFIATLDFGNRPILVPRKIVLMKLDLIRAKS
jgi:hypothetical protein